MSVPYLNLQIEPDQAEDWAASMDTVRLIAQVCARKKLAAMVTVLWWSDVSFTVIPAMPDEATTDEAMTLLHAASAAMRELQERGSFKKASIIE